MNVSSERVKCVVWDLDNTLWPGTLLEGTAGDVRPELRGLIERLDQRGILHSVASRGDEQLALAKLSASPLAPILLHVQIGWMEKCESIERIADALNIGVDTILFVDDDPFERAGVAAALPSVACVAPDDLECLERIASQPIESFSSEARQRRGAYKQDERRALDERRHPGGREGFLRDARMRVLLRYATVDDVGRLAELVERTNQMNTAGRAYTIEELSEFAATRRQHAFVLEYEDAYGALGTVGLAVLDWSKEIWTVRLALVSCRLISRGAGMVMFAMLARLAAEHGCRFRAEYVPNGRNRPMQIALALAGFEELPGQHGALTVLERPATLPIEFPSHVEWRVVGLTANILE
jgi:FkbH-like protein